MCHDYINYSSFACNKFAKVKLKHFTFAGIKQPYQHSPAGYCQNITFTCSYASAPCDYKFKSCQQVCLPNLCLAERSTQLGRCSNCHHAKIWTCDDGKSAPIWKKHQFLSCPARWPPLYNASLQLVTHVNGEITIASYHRVFQQVQREIFSGVSYFKCALNIITKFHYAHFPRQWKRPTMFSQHATSLSHHIQGIKAITVIRLETVLAQAVS